MLFLRLAKYTQIPALARTYGICFHDWHMVLLFNIKYNARK